MAVTTLRIKVGDQWYTVQVGDLSQSPVEVIVEGQTYSVEVEGLPAPRQPRPRAARPSPPDVSGAPHRSRSSPGGVADKILRSPMAGRVIAILVRPGDRVSAGDEVCVVEAMKMEQSVRAPEEGVVKSVHVQPMDRVTANAPLVELE